MIAALGKMGQLYIRTQEQRNMIVKTLTCDSQLLFDIDENGKLQGIEILLTDKEIIKQITEAIK